MLAIRSSVPYFLFPLWKVWQDPLTHFTRLLTLTKENQLLSMGTGSCGTDLFQVLMSIFLAALGSLDPRLMLAVSLRLLNAVFRHGRSVSCS